jgi:hypothetical protein
VANIIVRRWVDSALLGLAKELVESIERSLLSHLILGVEVLRLADGIVDWTVGRALLRCSWSMVGAWI